MACQLSEELTLANNNGLTRHNSLRARHGVPNLVLDATLANDAQIWAKYLASKNTLQHSGGKFGENLYSVCSSQRISNFASKEKIFCNYFVISLKFDKF